MKIHSIFSGFDKKKNKLQKENTHEKTQWSFNAHPQSKSDVFIHVKNRKYSLRVLNEDLCLIQKELINVISLHIDTKRKCDYNML